MYLSAKQSAVSTDTTNLKSNCIRDCSHGYIKKLQFFDDTNIKEISELDVIRRQKMAQERSSLHIECSIPNQDMKDGLQDLGNGWRKNSKNTFDSHTSEIDWNCLSMNLIQHSRGVGLTKHPSTSLELVAPSMRKHSGQEQMTKVMSLPNMEEETCCWHYSCNNDLRNEDLIVGGFTTNNRSNYGGMHGHAEFLGFSEARYLPRASLDLASGRLYDQASVFTSPAGGQISGKGVCYREVTKNPNDLRVCASNNVVNLQKSCESSCAEGDYLFSDALVQKKRFRLVIDREKEIELIAENYPSCRSLSDIIVMKYRSLGIPVQVKAYHRQDKDKTNSKAFNISFKNSKDISHAFSLGKKGRLFPILEARPSPTNHVRYEVMEPTGVFEGKCFRHQQIHQLRKGDVVTANQLKGNRIRIIKWCPAGYKMNLDLQGWVLVNTKDVDLLRRIYYWEADESVVNKDRSSTSSYSLQKQMFNKCNPQRVSPANCCPFKVLVEVEVRKGRKEPAIVGRLKPGDIVWANQHKGSMLRIIKQMNSDIVGDSTVKPEVWGWVCLQRKHEEKPRLIRVKNSATAKTKSAGKFEFPPKNARSTRNQPRESRNMLKSDMNTPHSGHFFKKENTLECNEDKVLISSSPYHSKTQVIPRQQQGGKLFPEIRERYEPSTIEMSIPNTFWGMEGQPKSSLKLSIPYSMSYSRSTSPMSISST